jgi:hypothetical protein
MGQGDFGPFGQRLVRIIALELLDAALIDNQGFGSAATQRKVEYTQQ